MSPFSDPRDSHPPPPPRRGTSLAFLLSIGLHAGLALALVVAGLSTWRTRRVEPRDVLVDFTVAVPPEPDPAPPEPEPPAPEPPAPDPEPPPPPEPDPVPVAPPPKPAFEKGKIVNRTPPKPEPKRTIVKRPEKKPDPPPKIQTPKVAVSGPKLSPEEIRKLLDKGATISDQTSIPPDENARCLALINKRFRDAWIRPDASAITGREPAVTFRLGPGGTVSDVRLSRSSGNDVLDKSALSAARAVQSVPNLSPGFIRANPVCTLTFELQES